MSLKLLIQIKHFKKLSVKNFLKTLINNLILYLW